MKTSYNMLRLAAVSGDPKDHKYVYRLTLLDHQGRKIAVTSVEVPSGKLRKKNKKKYQKQLLEMMGEHLYNKIQILRCRGDVQT